MKVAQQNQNHIHKQLFMIRKPVKYDHLTFKLSFAGAHGVILEILKDFLIKVSKKTSKNSCYQSRDIDDSDW